MNRYRRHTAVPLTLGLLAGALLSAPAFAATAMPGNHGAIVSAELKANNPQALQFEDNGVIVKPTLNDQVHSSGRLGMAAAEPAWMGDSGVVLDRGRAAGLYTPGEISYLQQARPNVVLAMQDSIAEVFQSPVGAINMPTLLLPENRPVTFTVMDFSISYPGTFTVVRKAPPYPTFIKMQDENTVFDSGWINRTPMSGAYSPYRTITYTFTQPGTYYYLSRQPGNAAGGQWGKIIVEAPNNATAPNTTGGAA